MKNKLPFFKYFLSIYAFSLLLLSCSRLLLFFTNRERISDIENEWKNLFISLLIGFRFDSVIVCYIIALPILVLGIFILFNLFSKTLLKFITIYIVIIFSLVISISLLNIPYFSYNFEYMGASVVSWFQFGGTTIQLLISDKFNIFIFILIIVSIIAFIYAVKFFNKNYISQYKPLSNYRYKIIFLSVLLLFLGVVFLGIRGSIGRYPIRISSAFFSDDSFFNKLGVNPSFYLIKNYSEKTKKRNRLSEEINIDEALKYVQNKLNVEKNKEDAPLYRLVKSNDSLEKIKPNIIIVLMESLSSEFLNMSVNGKVLTPRLHQLIEESLYFENVYSAGIHTNNGITATHYGFPPIFDKSTMSNDMDYYLGLPYNLKELGYNNYFFITSEPNYDNMNSFLKENYFKKIYSEYDYPSDKITNNFGIADDYLFEFGIEKLNEMADSKIPFLSTFLTVSNHPPIIVPEEFKSFSNDDGLNIVAFADDAIGKFMDSAKKQSWYNNTIFVFVGDHGQFVGRPTYEMLLSFNHVPLIIHIPFLKEKNIKNSAFGSQIDIFPTLMGIINQDYVNNSLGIDLLNEKREFSFFVSDTHLGCIDDEHFYIYNLIQKTDGLYQYREKNTENLFGKEKEKGNKMKEYGHNMMSVVQYMVDNKLTGKK